MFVSPFSRQTLHCNGANEEEGLVVEAKVLVHCSVEEGLVDEDAAPFSSGFIMESCGRNQVGNEVVLPGPPLDSIPSIPPKSPISRAVWRIALEQIEAIL